MLRSAFGFALLIPLAVIASGADKKPEKTDEDLIQGEWAVGYFDEQGKVAPTELFKTLRYVFKAGKFAITVDGKARAEGTYKLDETQNPKHLDIVVGDQNGSTIYKLNGDSLTLCGPALVGKIARPTEFKAKPGSGHLLLKFDRAKK